MSGLWKKNVVAWMMMGLLTGLSACKESTHTQVTHSSNTDKLSVVVSFSVLADMVQQIGGERIHVVSLVGRGRNPHAFESTPSNLKLITQADVWVVNGLGFEGWLNRATDQVAFTGVKIEAAQGVPAPDLTMMDVEHADAEHDHKHGVLDPHVWQSPVMVAKYYVPNILVGLQRADPAGADYYQQRADAYLIQLHQLNARIQQLMSTIAPEHRKVVVSHSAFQYFGQAYGVRFYSVQGVGTETQSSAQKVAQLIKLIQHEHIHGLFVENVSDPRLIEQIARDTGVQVGGRLFTDALSEDNGVAPTYLKMMEYNATTLLAGMK